MQARIGCTPRNPDKPEPNTFFLWPQKKPLGREQLGLELVAERLGAEWQPTFSLTHLTINSILF